MEDNQEWTFLLEPAMIKETFKNKYKILVVSSIDEAIEKLFNYQLKMQKAKFICATGSVGKTTMISLLEQVLKEKYQILRIYSKRITPLILKSFIINHLSPKIDYCLLEAGMFHKHHVQYFGKILNPEIGIFLNVELEHIGIDNIKNYDDIIKSKAQLLAYSKIAILNNNDRHIRELTFENNEIKYKNKFIAKHHLSKIIRLNIEKKNGHFLSYKPYILTKLSLLQDEIALKIGMNILKIKEEQITKIINNFVPSENRIGKHKLLNKEIVFDGEVSGVIRFKYFTNHLYKKAILIIQALTEDGEEQEDYTKIVKYFKRFDKVYIFENCVKLLGDMEDETNVQVVTDFSFLEAIQTNTIFYHYGSYYRKYNEYDENVLLEEIK